jgi:hypothetical protein
VSVGDASYSVPHDLIGERVWVRVKAEQLIVVHIDPDQGPREVAAPSPSPIARNSRSSRLRARGPAARRFIFSERFPRARVRISSGVQSVTAARCAWTLTDHAGPGRFSTGSMSQRADTSRISRVKMFSGPCRLWRATRWPPEWESARSADWSA